jgi:hypothetical protein
MSSQYKGMKGFFLQKTHLIIKPPQAKNTKSLPLALHEGIGIRLRVVFYQTFTRISMIACGGMIGRIT